MFYIDRMGKKTHKRDAHITFHDMGVSGLGERFEEAKRKGWKMKSISEIIQYLGHEDVSLVLEISDNHFGLIIHM